MGKFKTMVVESEHFDQVPPPKRVADLEVEPMPHYDRPRVWDALKALEYAKAATPTVSRKAQALFLVRALVDKGADPGDFDGLIAFGWTVEELADAAQTLGVEF